MKTTTKKSVTATLFITWAFFTAVLVAGLVFYQNNRPAGVGVGAGSITAPSGTSGPPITLTADEIAKHNSASDCWIIVNNRVYNVTSYLNIHPGGAFTITPSCGKEATTAYNDKGRAGGPPHSSFADTLLADFLVGGVGETVSSTNANPQVTVPAGGGRERGDDD